MVHAGPGPQAGSPVEERLQKVIDEIHESAEAVHTVIGKASSGWTGQAATSAADTMKRSRATTPTSPGRAARSTGSRRSASPASPASPGTACRHPPSSRPVHQPTCSPKARTSNSRRPPRTARSSEPARSWAATRRTPPPAPPRSRGCRRLRRCTPRRPPIRRPIRTASAAQAVAASHTPHRTRAQAPRSRGRRSRAAPVTRAHPRPQARQRPPRQRAQRPEPRPSTSLQQDRAATAWTRSLPRTAPAPESRWGGAASVSVGGRPVDRCARRGTGGRCAWAALAGSAGHLRPRRGRRTAFRRAAWRRNGRRTDESRPGRGRHAPRRRGTTGPRRRRGTPAPLRGDVRRVLRRGRHRRARRSARSRRHGQVRRTLGHRRGRREPVNGPLLLPATEFDVVWRALDLGDPPLVLTVPSPGRTRAERAAVEARVWSALRERGLAGADGAPLGKLTGRLTTIARSTTAIELRGWQDGEIRRRSARPAEQRRWWSSSRTRWRCPRSRTRALCTRSWVCCRTGSPAPAIRSPCRPPTTPTRCA